MFQGKKILFVSQTSGFSYQVEQVLWQMARLLRRCGATLYGAFFEKGLNPTEFEKAFDEICQPDKLPKEPFDLACIHQVPSFNYHLRFQKRFKDKAALFIHDHSCYCPRGNRRLPFTDKECDRQYDRLICSSCGWLCKGSTSRGHFREKPCFASLLASPMASFNSKVTLFQDRLDLMRRYRKCVIPNGFMRDNLLANGFLPEYMHVIPYYLSTAAEMPERTPANPPRILLCCQPDYPTANQSCIQALAKLHHPYQAIIQAPKAVLNRLKRIVGREHLGEKVQFREKGFGDDPLPEAEIALVPLPSNAPYSIEVAECADKSIPVISSTSRGLNEALQKGESGFALDCLDADAIANSLDKLLESPELQKDFGANGFRLVRQSFSQEEFLRRFKRLLL